MSSINSVSLPNIKSQIQNVNNAVYGLFQKITQVNNDLLNDQGIIKDLLNETYVQANYMEAAHQFYDAASRGQTDDIRKFGDTVFLKYYYDLILSFESRLQQYEINIEELDRQIQWLNSKNKSESGEQDLKALSESLRNQHDTLMSMTGKVALMHENVEKLQQKYLNYMQANYFD
ncbi:1455_t:CDS:2 [Entrophospora sp. SA101]|nr:12891_t:CDS:2 [Entrophospora candida]CAG8560442.1 5386_t:CDS:2 [Entrophospora candida]CAH1760266.1 8494_t:CDS:2 [Entrophospora sp. SA101]CAJ0758472.1 1455_t:CDS:2 [Entrophospora sp. SA101]CAJ0904902.1 10424_t:CDS:2 [Entrophospora sp. SA101]